MKKKYNKGNLYQISFEGKYGYLQEYGEWTENDIVAYFVVVYEQFFTQPIRTVNELLGVDHYVAHFVDSVQAELDEAKRLNKLSGSEILYSTIKNGKIVKYIAKISLFGKEKIISEHEIPMKLRIADVNMITHTYKWEILTPHHKYISSQKTCKGIEDLSPYFRNVSQTVSFWSQGIRFVDWNDKYMKEVIEFKRQLDEDDRQITIVPTNYWLENCKEGKKPFYNTIHKALLEFEKTISNGKYAKSITKEALKTLYRAINDAENEDAFLETQEREDILNYLYNQLSAYDLAELLDDMEILRN